MGKYFMPSKEAAVEFESQARDMGLDTTTVESNGELYVLTDDDRDTGEISRAEYSEQVKSDLDAGIQNQTRERIAQAKREAEEIARDDWDDALPDESPIGKSEEKLAEMESREDERLGRAKGDDLQSLRNQAEREKVKAEIRRAKREGKNPRDIGSGIKTALNIAGVGKVNKKALGLYTVQPRQVATTSGMYSGDTYAKLRELTSPRNIKTPSISIKTPNEVQSPLAIAAKKGTGHGLSPLSIAAVGEKVDMGISPLAQVATKTNIKASKIGQLSTNLLMSNPAAQNPSLIARIAKQSAIIKMPGKYTRNINKLKR